MKTVPASRGLDRTNTNMSAKTMKPTARTMALVSSSSRSYQFFGLALGVIPLPSRNGVVGPTKKRRVSEVLRYS